MLLQRQHSKFERAFEFDAAIMAKQPETPHDTASMQPHRLVRQHAMNARSGRPARRGLATGLAIFAMAAMPVVAQVAGQVVAPPAVEAAAFDGLADSIERSLADIRSAVVMQRGRVVFEYHRSGYTPGALHPVESVTKSVLSMLVGSALAAGRIASLDQPVIELMPELAEQNPDPRARRLTLRHLLTMTAGFEAGERRFFDPKERAAFALSRRFEADPGQRFRYDNAASDLLSALLEKAVGQTPAAYAEKQLFGPLGIERFEWQVDAQGHNLGFRGLALRTRDMARLGQLFLQSGQWEGRALVPAPYAQDATAVQNAGGPPVGLAYGYSWWVVPSAPQRQTFFASGFGGQLIWVHVPLQLVVATTSQVSHASNTRGQAMNLARGPVFKAALEIDRAGGPPR